MKKFFVLLLLLATLGVANTAQAGFYVDPKLGWLINDEGEADTSAGLGVGYRFINLVGVEVNYQRVFANVDSNVISADVNFGFNILIIRPYILAGLGLNMPDISGADTEALFRVGLGAQLKIIDLVRPFAQVSYVNIDGDNHLVEPLLGVSFNF